MFFKALVVAMLIAIVLSLASALFHLMRERGQSDKTVNALTVRVTLSFVLLLILIIGSLLGYIHPHGIGQ